MDNFELHPGDWIPTCEVPPDKRQAVIDAFVAAGAGLDHDIVKCFNDEYYAWVLWDKNDGVVLAPKQYPSDFLVRRVTLGQILGDKCHAKGSILTVEVPKEPTSEMINSMFDAMRKLEDEEYPGHMAKYSVNDMLAHVWIAGVNAAKVSGDD